MYLKKTAIKIIKGEYTMKNFKKFLSGITALTMLSSLCIPACAATVTTLGDLNNDGSVNILDFTLMKQYIVSVAELDEQGLANADMNSSGEVNIFDAVLLARDIIKSDTDTEPAESEESTITLLGDSIETSSSTVKIENSVATITVPGTYTITGTLNDGQIIVDVDKTLYPEGAVELSLEGVDISCSDNSPLYIASIGDECTISVKKNTENVISDGTSYTNADEDSGAIYSKDDIKIKGKGSLTVNGNCADGIVGKDDVKIYNGNITVNAADDGIRGKDSIRIGNPNDLGTEGAYDNLSVAITTKGGDGIKSTNETDEGKGYVTISGGTLNINAYADGIQAEQAFTLAGGDVTINTYEGSSFTGNASSGNWGWGGGGGMQDGNSNKTDISAKGIKSNGTMTLSGGTVNIDSSDDCIHSASDITFTGGTYTLATADDGVHSDADLIVNGGTIDVTKSYEGLEGVNITINDGSVKAVASDDGFNAAGGTDNSGSTSPGGWGQGSWGQGGGNYSLNINGGYVFIDAGGDGLDSNGSITITGGYTVVNGPTSNGDSPVDCDGSATMTGGTVLALGSTGMISEGYPSGNAYFASTSLNASADTQIVVTDDSGNVLAAYTTIKQSAGIIFTSDGNTSYHVYTGASYTPGTAVGNDGLYTGGSYSGGTEVTSGGGGGGGFNPFGR